MTQTPPPALFQASVPVFLRYLGQLEHLLVRGQQHAQCAGIAEQTLLDAALAPDMLPFATQVEIACNFTLRAAFPLAGLPIPPYGVFERSFSGLQQRIARARQVLTALDPAAFVAGAVHTLQAEAGRPHTPCPPMTTCCTTHCPTSSSTPPRPMASCGMWGCP